MSRSGQPTCALLVQRAGIIEVVGDLMV